MMSHPLGLLSKVEGWGSITSLRTSHVHTRLSSLRAKSAYSSFANDGNERHVMDYLYIEAFHHFSLLPSKGIAFFFSRGN